MYVHCPTKPQRNVIHILYMYIYIRESVDSLCINNVYECRLMVSRSEPICCGVCTQPCMCEHISLSTPANTVAQRFLPLSILVCMYCVQESVHHCRHKAWDMLLDLERGLIVEFPQLMQLQHNRDVFYLVE